VAVLADDEAVLELAEVVVEPPAVLDADRRSL
jgi:hypothetical protein